jgi:hypothetical protein
MQQCPQLRIASKNNVPSSASIATIWPAFLYKFFAMKMQTPGTSVSRL